MADMRRTFLGGKMNKDADNRLLQDGDYRDAFNVLVTDSEGSDAGAIQNSLSTKQLSTLDLGANPITLGGLEDEKNQKLYWAVKSDTGCYILEYDAKSNSIERVLEDTRAGAARVLDFKEDKLITAFSKLITADPSKDLIIINDDNLQPLCFNPQRAKTYGANGFAKEDIFLIKKPPRFAPDVRPTYVDGVRNNFIEEKFLSFSYRYKYLDGEYSALSSFTNYVFYPKKFKLDYEVMDNLGMTNLYNGVVLTINTGDKRVTDIQVVVKISNSNNLYLIETFNKANEGWSLALPQFKDFTFSNDKIYTVLPEKELFRAFDNVPLKAKAHTLIGNRLVMGNYVEGYDLIDKDGHAVNPKYDLSIISKDTLGIPLSSPPSFLIPFGGYIGEGGAESFFEDDLFTLDFSEITLSKGGKIGFSISLKNDQANVHNYNGYFEYLLTKDYVDANALATDIDFGRFIMGDLTDDFRSKRTFDPIPDSTIDMPGEYSIVSHTATTIVIKCPSMVFNVGEAPPPVYFYYATVKWLFRRATYARYYQEGNVSTVKTNRSYEAGIVYLDEFNRQTTVLTHLYNTVFVPNEYALSKNSIRVSLTNTPPAFADRYKIVVKQQTLRYQTIYASTFYIDGLFRWIKLDGDNKDKVKAGDTLIIKSGTKGFIPALTKIKVLEITAKDELFVEGNNNLDGSPIKEQPGLYMKIKPPANVAMDYIADGHIERSANIGNHLDDFYLVIGAFSTKNAGVVEHIPIKQGSRIDIELHNIKYGRDGGNRDFVKTYYSGEDYDNIKVWYDAEVQNQTGEFNHPANGFVTAVNSNGGGIVGGLYLLIHNELNGNGQHQSYMDGSIKITAPNGLLIFETEEKKSVDEEVYYETSETFEIINGYHQGNIQDQDSTHPAAIIDLDFFNCYCQGNGAESYIVKDAFNKESLNIDLRPSVAMVEPYKAVRRSADLIFGDTYVGSSNMNGLNVFNRATLNYKELDKQYGSIQKLHSRDNDILVLKEYKASKILFQKDALFNTDGSTNLTGSASILGTEIPYQGDNGIGLNPESFAENNYQIYYANPKQGNIIRLSIDGADPIVYGMQSWFLDFFRDNSGVKILGGYDPYFNQFIVSAAGYTISFSEKVKGWTSFWSYAPDLMLKLNNRYFSIKGSQLHLHNDHTNEVRNNFYGVYHSSYVKTVINDAANYDKIFKTMVLESTKPWRVIVTTNYTYSTIKTSEFNKRESRYFAYLRKNENFGDLNGTVAQGIGVILSSGGTSVIFNDVSPFVSVGDQLFQINAGAEELIGVITRAIPELIDVSSVVNLPITGLFCFAKKNPRIEGSEIRGNYMEVELINSDSGKNTLFAISSNVVRSFL